MGRQSLLSVACAPALCLGALACAPSEPTARTGPRQAGVVFCVLDTLRADHLSLYGYRHPTSPFLEELARESVVFERMYAQSSWTKASTASIFTGLHPRQHGAIFGGSGNHLAEAHTTLAEVFDEAGFHTAGFSENPHIQAPVGFAQGFATFEGSPGMRGGAHWVLQEAKAWLDELEDEPYFLYLHSIDPHSPYVPTREQRRRFLAGRQTTDERVRTGRAGSLVDDEALLTDWDTAELPYLRALYDAEIHDIDGMLRELWEHLAELGLHDTLTFLVTSDHGEEFLEHGSLKHGFRLYEESVRVPLLIRAPGFEPRRVSAPLVQQVDLFPTLLELFDLPLPELVGEHLAGNSLVPWMRGEEGASGPVFMQTDMRGVRRLAVRQGAWKLVVHADEDQVELFHLEEDPEERHDRSAEEPDRVQLLLGLHATVTAPIPGLDLADASGTPDPELEKALRDLGYLGD